MEKETRKQKNRQIERKKRAKQRTAAGIFVVILALAAVGIGYLVWDSIDRRTVMTFQGERIPTSDFRFLHMTSGAEPDDEASRETAVTAMLRTLAVLERARANGVSLPEDEMAELLEEAASTREWVVSWQGAGAMRATSVRRIADFMSVGTLAGDWPQPGPLFELLEEELLADFRPDQADIDARLEEWDEDITNAAMETMLQYIAVDDENIAWSAYGDAEEDVMPFDELIELFHQPGEDEFENPIDLSDFMMNFNAWEHWEVLNDLEVGDITFPLSVDDGERFFVVRKYSSEINEETLEEITENVVEGYIAERRQEAFLEMIDGWVAEAVYVRNERALARF